MKVLVLGYRKALHQRLLLRNFQLYVVDSKFPFKQARDGFIKLDLKDSKKLLELAQKIKPQFIIAATEKAVTTAAFLRQKLQIFGESYETSLVCTNKVQMKEQAEALHIPITPYSYVVSGSIDIKQISHFKLPIVIKPTEESGGRNTLYIETAQQATKLFLQKQLVESYIVGKECSVESLVQNGNIIFSNITSYNKKYSQNIVPANFSADLTRRLLTWNQKIIEGFNIQNSLCHAEFYYHQDQIIFGEIAIRPPGGYIMNLLELSYKTSFWDLFIDLQIGIDITNKVPHRPFSSTAVWIIHPGAGKVTSIKGYTEIQICKEYLGSKLKIKIGDICSQRVGSGQDCGYIIFQSKSPDKLIKALEKAENILQIGVETNDHLDAITT